MVNCSIPNCKNRSVKDCNISFFSFPKEEAVANAWIKYCKPKTNIKTGKVCSAHFITSDYEYTSLKHIVMNDSPRKCRKLRLTAIPSLHVNEIAHPLLCTKPEIDECLETVMETIQDPHWIKSEELSNSNNITSHSVLQTKGAYSDTITIPVSEYKDLVKIKNKHQTIQKMLSRILNHSFSYTNVNDL